MDRAALTRPHLDIAVDARNNLEFALVDLSFIARDRTIFTLSQNDAWKCANGFLDDVAAWRQYRPRGVGERLAATIRDQFQRDCRSTVRDGDISKLPGLHANVRTNDRIGIAVIRHDVVSAVGDNH